MSRLFVSKEHTRQTELRTHRAYHCIVYIVLGTALMQIAFGLKLLGEKNIEAAYRQRKAEAMEAQSQLLAKAEPLKELRGKVEEAQRWNEVRDHRTTVAEILSRLENSVSEGICFSEITVYNRALGPRDSDRFEVEVRGFAKSPEPEVWQHVLQRIFEEWNISAPRVSRLGFAGGPEGVVPFSLLLRQAVSSTSKKPSK